MKKSLFVILIISIVALTGCVGPQSQKKNTNELYTQVAGTVSVQLTEVAALTPSPTSTNTPEPTPTPTLTPIPSPTPLPPTPTWAPIAAGRVTAPILLYYRIAGSVDEDPNYQWESTANMSPSIFRQQLEVLKNAGYNTVTVSQLVDVVRDGGVLPPNPIVITFEGAPVSLYTQAYPIMKQFGFVGTVYAVVSQIDGKAMTTSAQLKEMIAAGWEVGSKGMTGIDLSANHEQAGYEISTSRIELGKLLGVEIKTYSYPGGALDDIISGARVSGWGYMSAAGLGKRSDITSGDIYYLPRYEIGRDMAISDFAGILPVKPATLPTQVTVTKQVQ